MAVPRSAYAIAAVWAITKTGAAWLPVDPLYPADRIAHMLDDSGVTVGVTTGDHVGSLPDDVRWVVPDDPTTMRDVSTQPTDALSDIDIGVDSAAYVIYTSGSTGLPRASSSRTEGSPVSVTGCAPRPGWGPPRPWRTSPRRASTRRCSRCC